MTDSATTISRADAYVNVDGVRKIYNPGPKQVEALSEVHCRVREGEFVSLLGPSGCGKSTLLMMVAGLESLSTGHIDVGGKPMEGTREDIGLMFQDSTLLPWKTTLENVMFPIKILKRSDEEYRETAINLLTPRRSRRFSRQKAEPIVGRHAPTRRDLPRPCIRSVPAAHG